MENHSESLTSTGNGSNFTDIGKAVAPDVEQLTRDFRTFVSDCEALLKNASALSGAGASVARAQLSEKMAAAKVKLDSVRSTANEKAAQTRATAEDYVRREPMKALGYALAAGAVLGLMMSRR